MPVEKTKDQPDPKNKNAQVQPGPKSGPPATADATPPESSRKVSARRDPERADHHVTAPTAVPVPARHKAPSFRPVFPNGRKDTSNSQVPATVTAKSPSDPDLLAIEPELGQEIRDGVDEMIRLHKEDLRIRENALETAIRLGHNLIAAKGRVGHGKFGKWIKAHTNDFFSDRTAQVCMRLAREEGRVEELRQSNPQRVADLSIRQTLRALAGPRPKASRGGATADTRETSGGASSPAARTASASAVKASTAPPSTSERRHAEAVDPSHGSPRGEADEVYRDGEDPVDPGCRARSTR
jgi:hypothetical protein